MDPKNPGSPLNAENVSSQTCGRCHGDPRLAVRYDLPVDRLTSYADSYHGLALTEGKVTAANCASCHGVHSILRSSDPRSTVNAANLAKPAESVTKAWSNRSSPLDRSTCKLQPARPSGRGVDPLDVLDPDPNDLGLHDPPQPLDFLRKLIYPRRTTSAERK